MGAYRNERLTGVISVNLEVGRVYLAERTADTKAWRQDCVCCLGEGEVACGWRLALEVG